MASTPSPYGKWQRATRKRLKISQERLADLTGIDRSHLSKLENGHIGKASLETRQKMHKIFGTSEQELQRLGVVDGEDELIHEVALHEEHARRTINGHADQLRDEAAALIGHFDERQLGAALQVLHMIDETPAAARLMVVEMRPMDSEQA